MNGDDEATAPPANLVELIDGLVEPTEPAPIPLTPETWGWAALAVLAALLVAIAIWLWIVQRRANAYRRAALAALANARTVAEVAAILRRAALAAWPREEVASLTGHGWTSFLARTGRGDFPEAAGLELRAAPYRNETAPPSPELRRAAADWLRRHRAASTTAPARPTVEAPA